MWSGSDPLLNRPDDANNEITEPESNPHQQTNNQTDNPEEETDTASEDDAQVMNLAMKSTMNFSVCTVQWKISGRTTLTDDTRQIFMNLIALTYGMV